MKRLFAIVFVLLSGFIKANKADSLLLQLKSNLSDTERVNVLNALCYEKYLSDINEARPYCVQALALAKSRNFYNGMINSYLYLSYLQKAKGENQSALKYADSALAICDKQNAELKKVRIYTQKGNIVGDIGDVSIALDLYLKAVKIGEKYNDKKSLVGCYANMGICFLTSRQYAKCYEYFKKSLTLAKEMNNLRSIGNTYNNIGTMFMETEQLDSAIINFKLGEEYYTKINYLRGLGFSAYYLGTVYNVKKNYPLALFNYQKAAGIYQKSGNDIELPNIFVCIADIYLKQNKLEQALAYSLKSLDEAKKNESGADCREAYNMLKQVYEAKGDYKTALQYYTLFVAVKDSLFSSESSAQMADMQTKYETDKKEQENQLLQEKNGIAAKTIRQQKYIGIAIGIICLLLIAFGISIFRANKQKHKINLQLERKNILIEKQKEEVEHQKELIEEKQKEILDSIHYAKRIQRALLPTEKYIDRNLNLKK